MFVMKSAVSYLRESEDTFVHALFIQDVLKKSSCWDCLPSICRLFRTPMLSLFSILITQRNDNTYLNFKMEKQNRQNVSRTLGISKQRTLLFTGGRCSCVFFEIKSSK